MWIADLIDRLPGQCWTSLAMWSMSTVREDPVPWKPQDWMCRKDAARNGRCYCGKLAADGSTLRRGEKIPTPAD
jgi:hypothetical protein